jgi:thioredoxin
MRQINEEDYLNILTSPKPTLIDFSASWCVPCQQITKTLEGLEADHVGIDFVKMDIDECVNITAQLGIRSVPTLILMKNGEPSDILVGAQSRGKIESFLRG